MDPDVPAVDEPIESYTPIAEKLIGSSVWLHPDPALLRVWLVMIVEAWKPRSKGQVRLSIAGLAHRSVVSVEDAKRAIDILRAPDPDSRNDRNGGQRIECLNPENPYNTGWKLLNWGDFHAEFKRANHAAACKRSREKKRDQQILSDTIRDRPRRSGRKRDPEPSPDPSPEPEPKKKGDGRFAPPSLDEVREAVREKGYHFSAEAFHAYYESTGWKVGKSPMHSWKSACVTWESREGGVRDARESLSHAVSGGNVLHNPEEERKRDPLVKQINDIQLAELKEARAKK